MGHSLSKVHLIFPEDQTLVNWTRVATNTIHSLCVRGLKTGACNDVGRGGVALLLSFPWGKKTFMKLSIFQKGCGWFSWSITCTCTKVPSFIVLTPFIYFYFFFELEPEWEDPEDCPRHLQSHEHHGKKVGLPKLDRNIYICLFW